MTPMKTPTTPTTLTPADRGILAAALDDALRAGLGDDDTVDALRSAARGNGIDPAAAYPFFRAAL